MLTALFPTFFSQRRSLDSWGGVTSARGLYSGFAEIEAKLREHGDNNN